MPHAVAQITQLLELYSNNIGLSINERKTYKAFRDEEKVIRQLTHENVRNQLEQNELFYALSYIKEKGVRGPFTAQHCAYSQHFQQPFLTSIVPSFLPTLSYAHTTRAQTGPPTARTSNTA